MGYYMEGFCSIRGRYLGLEEEGANYVCGFNIAFGFFILLFSMGI